MSQLTVNFTNNSTVLDSEVWLGFLPAQGTVMDIANLNLSGPPITSLEGSAMDSPPVSNWYTFADVVQGVSISSFSGGRIYVCYGTPWEVQYAGYEPSQSVTDPNFFLRYDKMEITFTGAATDAADLTSIDFWSIPMTLNTYMGTTPVSSVTGLLNGTTAASIYSALNALTTPPVSGLTGLSGPDGAPLPALVPGTYVQYGDGPAPTANFSRIIGPSSYATITPMGIPVQPYDLFTDYLTYLLNTFGPGNSPSTPFTVTCPDGTTVTLGNGAIAVIAGNYAGVGPVVPLTGPQSKQTYQLVASMDANCDITLTGNVSGSPGITTIVYANADLINPSGIYGGNAPFTLNGVKTTPDNNVYGWIGGDLFTGIMVGAIGSETPVQNGGAQTMAGALFSQSWFSAISDFFGALQPNNANYYNQFAATLTPLSQAYNFAFTDRLESVKPLLSLDPAQINTLEIVLDDTSGIPNGVPV